MPSAPNEAAITDIVAKYPSKTPSEVRDRMYILEATNTPFRTAKEIQAFRIRTCRGDTRYSNFQFATRSSPPVVTNFVSRLLSILTSLVESELRYGMTPPNSCNGSLEELFADMGYDSK